MERWLPIPDFPEYEASTAGRVRSKDKTVNHWRGGKRLRKGRVLKPGWCGGGGRYHFYRLANSEGKILSRMAHRLILETFVGPRPEGMQGCHNDNDPHNNAISNLRWDTPAANNADKIAHGTWQGGANHWTQRANSAPA